MSITAEQKTILEQLSVPAAAAGAYVNQVQAAPLVSFLYVETNPALVTADGLIAARITPLGQQFLASLAQPALQGWGAQQATAIPVPGNGLVEAAAAAPVATPAAQAPVAETRARGRKPKAAAVTQSGNADASTATSGPIDTSYQFPVTDVPLPESKRKLFAPVTKYPFDKLEVGKTFFVPNSQERPDAVRTMQSAASAATDKYAVDTEEVRTNRKGKEVPVKSPTRRFSVRKDVGTVADGNHVVGLEGARVGRVA